jgi:DNA-binding NarL/FixJ family response regulator
MRQKVVIADDHELILLGLRTVLEEHHYEVVASFKNGLSCLNYIRTHPVDLVILDIEMPGRTGIEIMQEFKGDSPKFIIMTLHKEEHFFSEAMQAGAAGYLLKEHAMEEIITCLDQVKSGNIYIEQSVIQGLIHHPKANRAGTAIDFSPSERTIMRLIAANKSTKEIAQILFLSTRTISNQRYNMGLKLKKAGIKKRLKDWIASNLEGLV